MDSFVEIGSVGLLIPLVVIAILAVIGFLAFRRR